MDVITFEFLQTDNVIQFHLDTYVLYTLLIIYLIHHYNYKDSIHLILLKILA